MIKKNECVFFTEPKRGENKASETFRLLYDVKGRFVIHRIQSREGQYKLCKVKKQAVGDKQVPYIVTHDARTIRYPDPHIKADDTVVIDIGTGKVTDYVKFDAGNICMITGGHNIGRVGIVGHRERHPGSFDIVHIKDSAGHSFATRMTNVFIIGKGTTPVELRVLVPDGGVGAQWHGQQQN
ncbi:hypothetical protein niasHT_024382 [Heterodera trifolii]|uniref:Small ribosomal subunit protein eS4 n=1 Tax=Heterodera trifolii TaxID=157864 RepID=A0ABD2JY40_9BILA